MMGLLERVATSIVARAQPKAAYGPGVAMVEQGTMLGQDETNSTRWLRKAQVLSHTGWVAVAERLVSGRAAAVPWHLEDAEGDTIDETSTGPARAAFDLLRFPMGQVGSPTPGGVRLTQRALWRLTLRHMGVCNLGGWYLYRQEQLGGTPLETHYVNPSRLTPATDDRGNLIGWVLDADETYTLEGGNIRGIPLSLDELVPFWLDPPEHGYYGVGLVEQAIAKQRLASSIDRFLVDTFATGGRRGTFIGPKAGTGQMPEEVFDALVKGLRNVADSPDSAKRNIVTRGPLEITPQASTPDELQVYEITAMTRDDILGMWGVPASQTGIPAPAGLNSGESRKYDEAALWQNAIHPRLDAFRETLQLYVLDRYKAHGVDVRLVLDEPSFDDEAPRYEIAEKAKVVPLMDNERRAITGHDPLPDFDATTGQPLGAAIRLPSDIVLAAVGPSDEPRPVIEPEPVEEMEEPVAKAKAEETLRQRIERTRIPLLRSAVARVLADQRETVLARLRDKAAHLLTRRDDVDAWWNGKHWDAALLDALVPIEVGIAATAASEVRRVMRRAKADDEYEALAAEQLAAEELVRGGAAAQSIDDFLDAARAFVRERAGERITGLNDTTRTEVIGAVRDVIDQAVREGLSPDQAADLLSDRVGGLSIWSDTRSDLVARTETMFAYNDAALHSYREYDVMQVEAMDGDYDDICAARNGSIYSIDEALGIHDHPNGTLDWAPIVETAKASRSGRPAPQSIHVAPAPITLTINDKEVVPPLAPVVDTSVFLAAVAALQRDLQREVQTIRHDPRLELAAKAAGQADALAGAIGELREEIRRPKRIKRDENGRIIGVEVG